MRDPQFENAPAEASSAAIPDDPKPVFEGDWNSASGKAKGDHSQRVREWRERTGQRSKPGAAKAGGRMAAGVAPQLPPETERDAADIATLEGIIAHAALASDRIRAVEAKQRILNRIEAGAIEQEHGELRAVARTLEALAPEDRVAALRALLVVA